jgi:hypothetical protein
VIGAVEVATESVLSQPPASVVFPGGDVRGGGSGAQSEEGVPGVPGLARLSALGPVGAGGVRDLGRGDEPGAAGVLAVRSAGGVMLYPACESRMGCTFVRETDDDQVGDVDSAWRRAVALQLWLDRLSGLSP